MALVRETNLVVGSVAVDRLVAVAFGLTVTNEKNVLRLVLGSNCVAETLLIANSPNWVRSNQNARLLHRHFDKANMVGSAQQSGSNLKVYAAKWARTLGLAMVMTKRGQYQKATIGGKGAAG